MILSLLIIAAIVASFVIGLAILVTRRKTRQGIFVGIGIITAPWLLIGLLAINPPGIDEWNPTLDSDSSVWGTWEGDGYLIELKPDSSFSVKFGNKSVNGTWRRMDWNVYLTTTDGGERYMRFVVDSGDLLLLPDPPRNEPEQPGPITKRR